ncbi:9752_t:CDS:2, partial [Funneliformis geosporum]
AIIATLRGNMTDHTHTKDKSRGLLAIFVKYTSSPKDVGRNMTDHTHTKDKPKGLP